jgi:hypothetical protein
MDGLSIFLVETVSALSVKLRSHFVPPTQLFHWYDTMECLSRQKQTLLYAYLFMCVSSGYNSAGYLQKVSNLVLVLFPGEEDLNSKVSFLLLHTDPRLLILGCEIPQQASATTDEGMIIVHDRNAF